MDCVPNGKTPLESQMLAEALRRADQAEAASRAKSEFLAVLSHELRVSLTGIIGMAQLLNIDCLLPSQHEQVEDILKSSEHILSLVDELLNIARMEAGTVKLEAKPFDFRQLLQETLGSLRIQAQAKGLNLLVNYDNAAPYLVMGDTRVLRQIILNLVGNALKFTPQGTILVKVTCQNQTEAQADLLLRVEDTGMGIVPEELNKLRACLNKDNVDGQIYERNGLGLAITNSYLKLMKASLQIESKPNHGSIVTCAIPFALQPKPVPLDATQQIFELDLDQHPRILYVEDHELIQRIYKTMLEQMGCVVDIASNATEALELHSKGYDLILMDIGLPEVSGLDITQEIRRREGEDKHTPIVAMTGYAHEQDRNNALQAGVDQVLVKPVRMELLKQIVQYWTETMLK